MTKPKPRRGDIRHYTDIELGELEKLEVRLMAFLWIERTKGIFFISRYQSVPTPGDQLRDFTLICTHKAAAGVTSTLYQHAKSTPGHSGHWLASVYMAWFGEDGILSTRQIFNGDPHNFCRLYAGITNEGNLKPKKRHAGQAQT